MALALVVTTTAISAKQKIDAIWGARTMTVDGNLDDWEGRLVPSRDAPVLIGVVNDAEFLYIAIRSADEDVARRAYYGGLIVWIRPKGGSDVGIQSPLARPSPRAGRHHEAALHSELQADTSAPAAESFILLGQGSTEGQRIAADNLFGVDMRTNLSNGEFVYELKVPLQRSALHPYALDTAPGAEIALEIETPDTVHANRDERSGRDAGGPGGLGGSGGGMHHHGGGMGSNHGGGAGGMSGGEREGESSGARPPAPLKV